MKKSIRFLAWPLSAAILASVSLPVFAATYEVGTSNEVIDAVESHANNDAGDTNVILNMKNDIQMEAPIHTQEGWSYTFQGKNEDSTQKVLADAVIQGGGSVVINADVAQADKTSALSAGGSAQVTVNGDVMAAGGTGVSAAAQSDDQLKVTVNGNIEASMGIQATSVENAKADLTVNGNITAETGALAGSADNANTNVAVNGNMTAADTGYLITADEGASGSVTVSHTGNIHSGRDAAALINQSESASLTLNLKGSAFVEDTEDFGIGAAGASPNAQNTIIVEGEINCPVYTIEEFNTTPLKAVSVTEISVSAPMAIPASFETVDLDGNSATEKAEGRLILVYFDPADAASCEQLSKAQALYADKGTQVYGVCLTEDYDAARTAAQQAGITYPILKNNDSTYAVLRSAGFLAPQASLMLENGRIIAACKYVTALIPGGSQTQRVETPIPVELRDGSFG